MSVLYIDKEFKLHTKSADNRTAVETDIFDGFCTEYIAGHIFVPDGMSHKKANGIAINGPFIQPWENDEVLTAYQRQQEADLAAAAAAYQEGVNSAYDT